MREKRRKENLRSRIPPAREPNNEDDAVSSRF